LKTSLLDENGKQTLATWGGNRAPERKNAKKCKEGGTPRDYSTLKSS